MVGIEGNGIHVLNAGIAAEFVNDRNPFRRLVFHKHQGLDCVFGCVVPIPSIEIKQPRRIQLQVVNRGCLAEK